MKNKKNIQEVVKKELPEFADECQSLTVDELNARLAKNATDAEALQEAKENDEELEEAKENVKQFSAPYREGKKVLRLKSRFLISLIKERGGDV